MIHNNFRRIALAQGLLPTRSRPERSDADGGTDPRMAAPRPGPAFQDRTRDFADRDPHASEPMDEHIGRV